MKEFLFGDDSPMPLGITVALITTAWLSFLSVVIFG
jgi:hypothetical protein